MEFIIFVYVIV